MSFRAQGLGLEKEQRRMATTLDNTRPEPSQSCYELIHCACRRGAVEEADVLRLPSCSCLDYVNIHTFQSCHNSMYQQYTEKDDTMFITKYRSVWSINRGQRSYLRRIQN